MVNMEATVSERLQPLNLSEKQIDQIVKKFMYSPNYSLAQLVLMFDGLIDYLEQCIVVLDILNNNQAGWLLEGNDVIIEADQLFNIYNSAIEDLWQKEAKVQELYADVFL
jgi:signal-transduction protein with cAMP-binding, CBS, and nucleotidyltransferase domain